MQLLGKGNHDAQVYLPVSVTRLIASAKARYPADAELTTDLSPVYVANKVSALCKRLVVVPGRDPISKEAQSNAILLYSVHLRGALASKVIAMQHRLSKQAFDWLLDAIEAKFFSSMCPAGDPCFSLLCAIGHSSKTSPWMLLFVPCRRDVWGAGSSVHRRTRYAGHNSMNPLFGGNNHSHADRPLSVQMTLNTFHHAGMSSKNITLGVPRLEVGESSLCSELVALTLCSVLGTLQELINVSASIKTPTMTLYAHERLQGAPAAFKTLATRLEHRTLREFVVRTQILFDPDPWATKLTVRVAFQSEATCVAAVLSGDRVVRAG